MKNLIKLLFSFMLVIGFSSSALAKEIPSITASDLLTVLNENKGKVIVLNFFATWCPPCKEEIPDIVAVRKELKEEDVLIIGLSVDEDVAPLESFAEEHKINYPVYHANNDIAFAYRISAIPHNIVYDKNLKVTLNYPGLITGEELKEAIEKAL